MEQLFYATFTVLDIIILLRQEWAWPSINWWRDSLEYVPHHSTGVPYPSHFYMTFGFAGFYIIYCARYLQAIVSVFLEHKRKDFLEMQASMARVAAWFAGWLGEPRGAGLAALLAGLLTS